MLSFDSVFMARVLVLATGLQAAGAGATARAQTPARQTTASAKELSLEDALRLSGPASEAVALARVAVLRARGEQYRAKSELFPQLTGSLSYTRQIRSQFSSLFQDSGADTTTGPPAPTKCDAFHPDPSLPIADRLNGLEQAVECTTTVNPFGGFSRLPFGQKNSYNFGLAFSQTLFSGGRIRGQMAAASAGQRTAEVALTSAEAQLLLDVVQAYYDAALSDRLLAIAEATLAQADTTLQQTCLRREVGTVPEFDLLRAQVALDNQRPIVIQRRTDRDLAYLRLSQLLNLPLDQPLRLTSGLVDTALSAVPTLARVVSAAPDTVATHRAPVRVAAEAVRAQEGQRRVANSQRIPALVLTSTYGRVAYPSRGLPGYDEFLTNWSVSLGVQVPLFTGGRLKGDRLVADAGLEEARLRLRQTTEQAQLDTRNTLALLEASEASWKASEGTASQAARAYQIADLRFREGVSTQTELLDARIALEQAAVNRAQASRDLQIARVRVALVADLPLAGTSAPSALPAPPAPVRPRPAAPQTQSVTATGQP